ncbi:MAG: 3-dehydroquinate synthase [Candidatus Gastranaerophilales bacterium]|nr:3-dehydroquinate synthase [Candidatus Gastranaerophilales bacterium]
MDTINIDVSNNKKSEIIIQEGLKDNIADFLEDEKCFLITNTTIKKLYPELIYKFHKDRIIIIEDGEKYKNLKTAEYIINELLKRKIERKDTIVALGGGVVGDIAGYCASVTLRGVRLIQMPTTLLAMCDSSIGGKTGVNSKYGKNLIGTFYLANKVLIDTDFIRTLNEYEYKCGLGEVLKYAFIEKSCKCPKEYNLLNFFKENQKLDIKNQIPFIVKACAHLKATVVEKDILEGNLRKILNFGHTYAHPIETLSNYKKISHGEAVSWGMQCASKLGYNLEKIDKAYFDEIIYLINKFGLIEHKINYKKEAIINLMKQDKKVEKGRINLLIPVRQAEVELFDNIDLHAVEVSLP